MDQNFTHIILWISNYSNTWAIEEYQTKCIVVVASNVVLLIVQIPFKPFCARILEISSVWVAQKRLKAYCNILKYNCHIHQQKISTLNTTPSGFHLTFINMNIIQDCEHVTTRHDIRNIIFKLMSTRWVVHFSI